MCSNYPGDQHRDLSILSSRHGHMAWVPCRRLFHTGLGSKAGLPGDRILTFKEFLKEDKSSHFMLTFFQESKTTGFRDFFPSREE